MRTAARRDPGANLYTRLNLKGRTPASYTHFCPRAQTVYQAILDDAEILQAMSQVGYDQERVTTLLQNIADLEELNRRQEEAKGNTQQLTQEAETLEKVVRADLRTLKAVVKLAFTGKAQQQVLESLRLGKA